MNRNKIAQLTLELLGQTLPINDFTTDNSLQARTINNWFEVTLKKFLRKHPWNFATSFAALPVGLSSPSAGYSYAYALPSDCLVIRRLAPEGCFPLVEVAQEYTRRWREINVGTGTEIWTNVREAHAEYTVNISVDYDFPDHFALGFAHALAKVVGPKIISNKWPQMVATFVPEVENAISIAIADDIATPPSMREMDCSFIQVRQGY